jgi:hypothetical protein
MRGVYEMSGIISGLAAAKTLAFLTAPASKVIEILSASVTNATNETNEQLECFFQRITTLGTPTATTVTPAPTEPGDQATGATAKINCTSEPTTYTANTNFGDEGFPSLGGWRYQPVPEERLYVAPGASIGLQLKTSPALGAFDALVRIVYREIG